MNAEKFCVLNKLVWDSSYNTFLWSQVMINFFETETHKRLETSPLLGLGSLDVPAQSVR